MVQEALDRGAFALLLPMETMHVVGPTIPPDIAVHYVLNVPEVAHRLAVAFYGEDKEGAHGEKYGLFEGGDAQEWL